MPIQSRNPATGEIVKTFEPHTEAQVNAALDRAVAAQVELSGWSFEARATALRKLAQLLRDEAEALGKLATLEMGKPYAEAVAEVKKCAVGAEYYADHAAAHLADEDVEIEGARAFRMFQPLGVVLAVMPWNYPFWQVFRFAMPALMAGNAGVLKHASNVPQCALACADLIARAGFPKGAFETLLIGGSRVEAIVRDDRIKAATLTGSEPAGAAVAAVAGEKIKPTVLELGGSDAFIVMPSADLDKAVEIGAKARMQNNGQSCIAAKRFIVHADIYDAFKAKMIESFESKTIGDPMDEATDIGPLVDRDARDTVVAQVKAAIEAGATRVIGGEAIEGLGSFFRPGILENIPKSADAYSEEIFAPVAALYKVGSLDAAIALANDSPFGLGSAIFTTDPDEQMQAIRGIEAGGTFVNTMTHSDPRLPFGGIKRSGYGRELAREGIRAFCNIKTAYIAQS